MATEIPKQVKPTLMRGGNPYKAHMKQHIESQKEAVLWKKTSLTWEYGMAEASLIIRIKAKIAAKMKLYNLSVSGLLDEMGMQAEHEKDNVPHKCCYCFSEEHEANSISDGMVNCIA